MQNERLSQVQQAIGRVLYGKEEAVELTMISLLSGGHVLLEDVPGTGKTMLAKCMAKVIDGRFNRIQMTPDVLPSDVTGIEFYNPKDQSFQLRPGPVMTNILLADEINRATPKTQSSLLEVMEETQVTIEGETIPIKSPFIVMATQNPIESQGTFPLPEAQMDRFLLQIRAGYPTRNEEKEMMNQYRNQEPIEYLQPILTLKEIEELRGQVRRVIISETVQDYMLDIVAASRHSENIDTGVSPRGTLAFMHAAQARAFIEDRSYVIPEDVKAIAIPVLAHRLVLSMEEEMRKSKEETFEALLNDVAVPVESGAGE